jgi:signal peptidase II
MKKHWLAAALLVALDQAVKLLIAHNVMGARVVWIRDVLRFEPFQNTNLNWVSSMAGIVLPVFVLVIFQAAVAFGLVLFYRYQRAVSPRQNIWLSLGFSLTFAGAACAFIDVVFWGGSIDYIGLFNWFIFDMKDVFLNAGWISIVLWFLSKEYKAGEHKDITFRSWLLKGLKL